MTGVESQTFSTLFRSGLVEIKCFHFASLIYKERHVGLSEY